MVEVRTLNFKKLEKIVCASSAAASASNLLTVFRRVVLRFGQMNLSVYIKKLKIIARVSACDFYYIKPFKRFAWIVGLKVYRNVLS
jgi:hypothetical protein